MSPFPRSKRNHRHGGSFQVSLDFSMASNQTARGIRGNTMTILAWIFMLSAWTLIVGCTVHCYWKLMSSKYLESDARPDESPAMTARDTD